MKKIALLILVALINFNPNILMAQSENPDFLRSIGKIYVVVLVIAVIFLALVSFLIYLDRRLTKLENQINEHD